MQELAALLGGEAGFGRVPAVCIEARGGERFEGALRLRGESAELRRGIAGREGNSSCVFNRHSEGGRNRRCSELSAALRTCGAQASCSTIARRSSFDAFALARVAEVNFGRGSEQAARDGAGQIPIDTRRGMGHSGRALHRNRNAGMGGATSRPRFLGGAEKPDRHRRRGPRTRRGRQSESAHPRIRAQRVFR